MRKHTALVIMVLFCISVVSAQNINLNDSLKLFYPFNGNALDSSGNNHHGLVTGAILTTDRFGNQNSAYEFDGDFDRIQTLNSFDYQNRSVSVWIKPYIPGGIGSNINVALVQDADALNYGQFLITFSNSMLTLKAGGNVGKYNEHNFPLLNWYHFVLIRDSLHTYYYINGVMVGEPGVANGNGSYSYPNVNLVIGGGRSLVNQFFFGKVDDLRVYNRVLTNSEIDSLYNMPDPTLGIVEKDSILESKRFISCYPNPTENVLNVTLQSIEVCEHLEISIYDQLGREVYNGSDFYQNSIQVDISMLKPGLYNVVVRTPEEQFTKRIIKS